MFKEYDERDIFEKKYFEYDIHKIYLTFLTKTTNV